MSGYKCIIIDDDPLITDLVMHFSEKCQHIDFCVGCNDAVDGLKLLSNGHYDILFLDFNMPGLSGKDLLELKNDKSQVVMITSNTEFAAESYQFDSIVDYLVKPLSYEAFENSILRIKQKEELNTKRLSNTDSKASIMIKDGGNWIPIIYEDILFIKSESNYCVFNTLEKKVMTIAKLKSLEEKLPSEFLRCHRSYIINTNYIHKLNFEEVHIGDTIIPVSAMYKDLIKEFIDNRS